MRYFGLVLIFHFALFVHGQNNEYYMTNAKIKACDGTLYDSEEGERKGEYDHNEDYIFTICVPGATSITLVFDSFCTERNEDYLILYEGRDTTARRIGNPHHGSISPGTVTSRDSCITLYFHSDKSVSCFGYKATWSTVLAPLPQPRFVRSPQVSCDDNVIGVRLDQKFNCDSIPDSAFKVTGPINPATISVQPVNCDANNETDTFNITVSPRLDRGGTYLLEFEAVKWDACDSPWVLRAQRNFTINDCPIDVELFADHDTICRGSCTDIWAEVYGGDSTNYVFNWNNGVNGRFGPHSVCPSATTTYILRVSDGVAVPDSDTLTIYVVDPPVAMPDTSVCETAGSFPLRANPKGGNWQGKGVTDTLSGIYDPQQARAGRDTVVYFFAGCSDTVIVDVRGIEAGRPNAACPFSPAFQVFDFSPPGGRWSGPNIDSAGRFTPGDTGTFTVTYTWSGCTDTKTINVYPVHVPEYDTFCLSENQVQLQATPVGGRWSGPGISDPLSGIFYPPVAGAGNRRLIYTSNGCRDTTWVHVISINARGNQVACPDAPPFNILQGLPAGGYWTGVGITDSMQGTYDASFVYGLNRTWFNDTLKYYLNGCVDWKMMFVRQTVLGVDTLKHCIGDPRVLLDFTSTRRSPGGGIWSGPGITGNYFYPDRAGHGKHVAYYTANGCRDSLIMEVYPAVGIQTDTNFCITDPPFVLRNDQGSGYFTGPGIRDSFGGVFEPARARNGIHTIYYHSRYGCIDSLSIEVYGLPFVRITATDPFYCVKDSVFTIGASPAGGMLYGNGVQAGGFNPKQAGSGNHKIYYQYGRPTCYSTDSATVSVIDTLKVRSIISSDTICDGENIICNALPAGGTGNYSLSWYNGTKGSSLIEYPMANTWVWCEVRDGCSDAYRDSIWLVVHPKVHGRVQTSPIQCYGQSGFAEVIPDDNEPYEVRWHTSPSRTGFRLQAPVANRYLFTLRNTQTGCTFDSSATIPGYNRISAYFVTSPREGYCLNPFDPVLNFINQSIGATGGYWAFGDGDTVAYDPASNPQHYYRSDTNNYTITLVIWNEGGCGDTIQARVCIDDSVYVLVPSAFSPNGDGVNDLFSVPTAGVTEFDIIIFNRWGEHLFRSSDKDFSWDGTYLGAPVQKGAYPYQIKYKGKKTNYRITTGILFVL
ncbi:MAG: gliding motility-associated C-terminal domain-containing protein [Flavobacteriales bacterium]|nr:gliding motility-associated C-terminal domain-containing protein [Flavobacteriales bacterium]